jgi:ribosomal protein S18 acetylase RimI-like enzyme
MQIVYQGKTKSGLDIIIRYPEPNDVKEMRRYINELSKEKTFIRFQGEQTSLEEENKYLETRLIDIKNKRTVQLLVFLEDKLIANSDIHMLDKTENHIGALAISVAKNFRGEGIGKLLMEVLLKETEKELPDLKIVTLEVYQANVIAQNLYKSLGFVEYGRLPKGIMRNNLFEDGIYMYKNFT